MQQFIHNGCAHLTVMPHITLNGDAAEAVAKNMADSPGRQSGQAIKASSAPSAM